jgi:hypothetical protein
MIFGFFTSRLFSICSAFSVFPFNYSLYYRKQEQDNDQRLNWWWYLQQLIICTGIISKNCNNYTIAGDISG